MSNVVSGVLAIVFFVVGIVIIAFSFELKHLEAVVFVVGILVITAALFVPMTLLEKFD